MKRAVSIVMWMVAGGLVWACGGDDESGSDFGSGGGGSDGGGVGGGAASSGSGGGINVGGSNTGGASGGGNTAGTGGSAGLAGGTGGTTGSGGSGGCAVTKCQTHVYACGDCTDNDNDGLIDMQDPDCLGPCHNAENTFYGSIPGQAGPPCTVDCYFDQDSGSGNDNCHWNHECDPLAVGPNYPPEWTQQCSYDPNSNIPGASCTGNCCDQYMATQENACKAFCGPLTPNGCDCFGCCELPAGSNKFVWLGSEVNGTATCTLDDVSDPAKCHACTPVQGCFNPCAHCELCLGKTKLPDDCQPTGTGGSGGTGGAPGGGGTTSGGGGTGGGCVLPQCSNNAQPCGVACAAPCPANYFCLTGCCQAAPK